MIKINKSTHIKSKNFTKIWLTTTTTKYSLFKIFIKDTCKFHSEYKESRSLSVKVALWACLIVHIRKGAEAEQSIDRVTKQQ